MPSNPYEDDLGKTAANYQPLTPLTFLERASIAFPNKIAIIHGAARMTYGDFYARARRLASALAMRDIGPGDTVSVMLSNTPAMLEAHFGVAMTGAVLHSINTRLDAAIIAFQLDHANSKVLIVDREFSATVKSAVERTKARPLVVDYADPEFPQPGAAISILDYEAFVSRRRSELRMAPPGG